jgi:hypothetical protein
MKQTKLRRLVLAAMVGLTFAAPAVVATAAPASGAPPEYATLHITRSQEHPGYYDVVVSGHFNTTATSSTVGMRLKGADSWFDDDLGVSVTGQAWEGEFALYARVWHGILNEDSGTDEIYAVVRTSTGWSRKTPEVTGNF